jgi:DNA-binding NtrC family response regulator
MKSNFRGESMPDRILVIDDVEEVRSFMKEALTREGLKVADASDAETGLAKLENSPFDLVITDVKLPGMSGIEMITKIKEHDAEVEVIVMTGYDTKEIALDAIKNGAYDYFSKPFKLDEMNIVVKRALEKKHLQRELKEWQTKFRVKRSFGNLVGMSDSMQKVYGMIEKVAPTDTTVLIFGESGTGKEVLAEAIHQWSLRKDKPLVKINCAAIPETLLESELFGYEKGAFTHAIERKPGKFELADGGTIFLDEVGDMSRDAQAKLLRTLQGSEFDTIGGTKPITVDVRVIAATNKILADEVKENRFREDLFFRLSVFTISMPPLREKKDDIPLLVEHFIEKARIKQNKPVKGISNEAMALLIDYHWPGNVRQLENCIERAVVLIEGDIITAKSLDLQKTESWFKDKFPDAGLTLDTFLENVERKLIIEALEKTGGVQAQAAKLLGVTERSIWYRVKKLSIDLEEIKTLDNIPLHNL